MKINNALSAAAKKATSIITMASMLSSMVNLGLMLPAKAQNYTEAAAWIGGEQYYRQYEITQGNNFIDLGSDETSTGTIATLSSFINNPIPGSGNGNENTNISYTFDVVTNNIEIGEDGGFIKIATNNSNNTINSGTRENWNSSWVEANDPYTNQNTPEFTPPDITFNFPANVSISMIKIIDGNNDGAENTLYIGLACDIASNNNIPCLFDPNSNIGTYSIDLKNNPLRNPDVAGPHRQLFILGKNSVDQNGVITESGVGKMTINSYYSGLTVQASVDARLTFAVSAYDVSQINPPNGTEYAQSTSNGCNFGTIMPSIRYVCIWQLDASTNAVGGLQVYVVQDQNMTYPGSGAEIEQFEDGTLVESAAPAPWSSPTGVSAGGANAHLAYSSNDIDVFPSVSPGYAAGITTMTGAGAAATAGYGSLVADAYEPGDHQWLYGNFLMSTVELEQAPASLGQSYGHTQYFIVVGNF